MYSVERLLGGGPAHKSTIEYPLEHLVACHERIEDRLRVLERVSASLEERPNEARDALASVFRYFESSGVLHTEDEERSVFPRMAGRLPEEDAAYLASLEEQHREADTLYDALKQVPEPGADLAAYRDTIARFCAFYRAHIASENERLIAAARRVLTEPELAEISMEMRRRRGL